MENQNWNILTDEQNQILIGISFIGKAAFGPNQVILIAEIYIHIPHNPKKQTLQKLSNKKHFSKNLQKILTKITNFQTQN